MAFTVTARHSGTSGATAVQTQATNSTTPTANSLLLAFACVERDLHTVVESWTISGGGTWTAVDASASFAWTGTPDFNVTSVLRRLAVGASPSAHTITADAWSGVEDGYYSVIACDITGHNTSSPVVQSKTGGATEGGGDSESLAVTFDSALTTGNLVIACFAAGNDVAGAFTAPTLGGQSMTQLHNLTGNFCHAGMWYREITGAESDRTVTCSDLGQSVGASAAILVEIAAAGGGTSHTQSPTDNLGLSDAAPSVQFGAGVTNSENLTDTPAVDQGKNPTDALNLTDTAALTQGENPADMEGLTDAAVLDRIQAAAEALGLTDAAQVSLSGAGSINATDNLGLTDAAAVDQAHLYTDNEGLTDSTAVTLGREAADPLGITDSVALAFGENPADTLGLSDAVSLFSSGSVTAADNLGVTDTTVLDQGHALSDSAGLSDAVALLLDTVRSIIDAAALTDSAQVQKIGAVTLRPNTGITPRPNTGTTARP